MCESAVLLCTINTRYEYVSEKGECEVRECERVNGHF